MRGLIPSLVCLCLAAVPSQARAKDPPDTEALKACTTGDVRRGVEILTDLYVRSNDTTYLFNQGRCYEQNHQWQSAIDRFREYLRKTPRLSKRLTADTEKHIEECKRFLAEEERKTAPAPQVVVVAPSPQQVSPAATPAMTAPQPDPQPVATAAIAATPTAARKDSGAAMRTTGIVVGSIGLASLATAVILNLKANQLASDVNDREDPSKRSSQPSYRTGSLVCYGVGGAAVLAGGVLYWLGYRSGQSNAVAVLPTWMPGTAGLAVRGEF
jgi:hypothetical protein